MNPSDLMTSEPTSPPATALPIPAPDRATRAEVLERRRAKRGTAEQEFTSDFSALMAQVKEAGLLARRPGWNTLRFVLLGLGYVVAFAMLFLIGESWWQMATAVVFGALFTQTAYVAHDAAHRQIFTNGKVGEWVSTIIGNLFIGLSYGWWLKKHNALHHANPNKAGVDGDIAPGALVFTAEDARERTGIAKWFAARQGWFFLPLLTLAGLQLHVNSVQAIIKGQSSIKRRWTEGILIGVRLIGFPLLAIWAVGPLIGSVFVMVQVAVFGVHMGGSFAPNHKGQPISPEVARWASSWADSTTRSNTTCSPACRASISTRFSRWCANTAVRRTSPTRRRLCSSPSASSSPTSTEWASGKPIPSTAPSPRSSGLADWRGTFSCGPAG